MAQAFETLIGLSDDAPVEVFFQPLDEPQTQLGDYVGVIFKGLLYIRERYCR